MLVVCASSMALACGPVTPHATQPAATAPAALAVAVTPQDLGALPEGQCDVATFLAQLGGKCALVDAGRVSGSGEAVEAKTASDHDACSVWNSGGMPPQTINIDLGSVRSLSGLLLVPDMTPPDGDATHVVEYIDDQGVIQPLVTASAHMTSAHGYEVAFPKTMSLRYLRVTTTKSNAWVAWREVGPMLCQ